MLKNMPAIMASFTVQTVLMTLSSLSESFYLTGSRFFGNASPNSDWDFFASDCMNAKQLENLGFKKISSEVMTDMGYDRSQFASIWEFEAVDGVLQIQLIQNVLAKQHVQNLIFTEYKEQFNAMPKERRKQLWSLLLKARGQGY